MPAVMPCFFADRERSSCQKRFRFYRCPVCKLLSLERQLRELRETGSILGRDNEYIQQIKDGMHGEVTNGRCMRLARFTTKRCDMKYCVYCKRALLEEQNRKMIAMSDSERWHSANYKENSSALVYDILN